MIRMKADHHARTPSCLAVADRVPYPNAIQLRAWPWLYGAYVKSVQQCARPQLRSGPTRCHAVGRRTSAGVSAP